MNEQALIKKISDHAKKFKSRANKSPEDLKRHDLIRPDEQKMMRLAYNELGWSCPKIGSVFDRDPRSVRQAIENYKQEQKLKPPTEADTKPHRDDYESIKQLTQADSQISKPSISDLGRKQEDQTKETTNRKLELNLSDSNEVLTFHDRQSELLSKLVKCLYDIQDITMNMTSSLSYGECKEDYREPLRRAVKLARDKFVSGRVFLPVDFVKAVDIFFLKIAEMDIELGSAMDANTPNGPERAQYWKKAGTIAHQEIPYLLGIIENQARMIITEKVNPETPRPSIEVKPKKDGDIYYLEVKNNGIVADFEAQIEIINDTTGYNKGKLYLGYWEFGHGSNATIGNVDRIKIAQLETTVPPRGAHALIAFLMTLQLYSCEKSGVGPPNLWNSTSWTITENNAILKPEYILKVTISSNPPLSEGKFIKDYKLNFEGLSEISLQ